MSSPAREASAPRGRRVKLLGRGSSRSFISDTSSRIPSSAIEPRVDTDDSESDLSESSEEPSDESSDDSPSEAENEDEDMDEELDDDEGQDGVVNLRANRGKKPVMKLQQDDLGQIYESFSRNFCRSSRPQMRS